MEKCLYCNKKCEIPLIITIEKESFSCCSDECSEKTLTFVQYAKRNTKLFLIGIIACPATLMFGSIIPYSL